MSNLKELNQIELNMVSGGEADWGETAAGFALFGASLVLAASPIGLVGLAGAAGFAYFGGTLVGSGITGQDVWGLN